MLEVRDATDADAAIVLSFIRKKAQFDRDLGAFAGVVQTSEELIRRHLFGRQPVAFSLLAEVDRRPVGFALFYFRYSSFRGRPSVWLDDLYVDPESRRAGAGLALMRRLSEVARRAGCSHIAWVASGSNEVGMGFYRKIGASVVEQVGDAVTLQIEPGSLDRGG